jgi:hypothetical protein
MRGDCPHGAVEGSQAERLLPAPEGDLDSVSWRGWMHNAAAWRPCLELDAPAPSQSGDHRGRQQATDADQRYHSDVSRRSGAGGCGGRALIRLT